MTLPRRAAAVVAAVLATTPALARAGALCSGPASKDLGREVQAHLYQTMMMDQKFRYERYGQGPLPSGPPVFAEPKDVTAYLGALGSRRAAVLYQVQEKGAVCTWLVSAKGVARALAAVPAKRYASLRERLRSALDPGGKARAGAPRRRGVEEAAPPAPAESLATLLEEASATLFPEAIARKLVDEAIDTLVVVPTEELGTLPFAAIPVDGKPLVDRASVVVAPTFAAFRGPPLPHRAPLAPAVIVGDPAYGKDPAFELPPLPGARAEAEEVGKIVGASPLLGPAATRAAVEDAIAHASGGPGLVYLATHGRADPENPLDGSVVWMAGGRWSAREISNLALAESRPLVVLSACQTALGKSFQVGTIGLARAWARAGASSVVMSLWRVDDAATRELMTRFVRAAADLPPDVALRRAMLELRKHDPDPAHWASFAVYGVPAPMSGVAGPDPIEQRSP